MGTLHDNDSSPAAPAAPPAALLAHRWGQDPGDPRALRELGRRARPGAAQEAAVSGRRVWPGHESGLHRLQRLPRPGPRACAPPSSPATGSPGPQRTASLGVRTARRSGLGRSRCKTTCSSRGERPQPQPASLPADDSASITPHHPPLRDFFFFLMAQMYIREKLRS